MVPGAPGPRRPHRHLCAERRHCATLRPMQRYRPGTALIVVDVQNDFADPAGGLSRGRRRAIIPTIDREIEMARQQRRHRRRHPGLASGRPRRISPRTAGSGRSIASPTRGAPSSTRTWHSPTTRHGSARAPTARTATPASRCATRSRGETIADRARGAPARRRHRQRRGRPASRPTTASRRPPSTRPRSASRPSVLTDAIAAVDLEPGDGERALERDATPPASTLWRTVMR